MKLFAYAGNMDVDMLCKIVPSAKRIGVARIHGYSFVFNKTANDQSSKANLKPSGSPEDIVWGVLIQIDDADRPKLFDRSSSEVDLKPEFVLCIDEDDEVHHAETYIAHPHAINTHLLPYDWYHKKIVRIAKLAQLPVHYINKLFLMSFKTDHDTGRRLSNLNKLNEMLTQ